MENRCVTITKSNKIQLKIQKMRDVLLNCKRTEMDSRMENMNIERENLLQVYNKTHESASESVYFHSSINNAFPCQEIFSFKSYLFYLFPRF